MGTTSITGGIIRIKNVDPEKIRFPIKSLRAREYAAREAAPRLRNVETTDTIILFIKYLIKLASVRTAL